MESEIASATPGQVFVLTVEDQVAPVLIVGSAADSISKDPTPVACVLDWLDATVPPLEQIAKLGPMPYRPTHKAGRRHRLEGRPIAGRVCLGDAKLSYLGAIAVPPTLAEMRGVFGSTLFLDLAERSIAESWANRDGWSPPNIEGPAPRSPGEWAELVDDDGVLVIAPRRALAERFATRPYDYSFPDELVAGARARVLFGWQTEREGVVAVTVLRSERNVALDGYAGGSCLDVGPDDVLLAMPYGSFTRGCDAGGDMTIEDDDSYAAFRVPEGRYRVGVMHMNDFVDDDQTVPQYIVMLVPTTPDDRGETVEDVVNLGH